MVMAGNIRLVEGTDYTVNYNLGSVRILNSSILSSGQEVTISFEKADLFNFQTKWLSGARAEYKIDEEINLGFTVKSCKINTLPNPPRSPKKSQGSRALTKSKIRSSASTSAEIPAANW